MFPDNVNAVGLSVNIIPKVTVNQRSLQITAAATAVVGCVAVVPVLFSVAFVAAAVNDRDCHQATTGIDLRGGLD